MGIQLEYKGLYYKYISEDGLSQTDLNQDSRHSVAEVATRKNLSKGFKLSLYPRSDFYNKFFFYRKYLARRFHIEPKTLGKSIVSNIPLFRGVSLEGLFLKTMQANNPTLPYFTHTTSYYDFDQLDDLSNFAANVAQQSSRRPLQIVRGVINRHNMNLLKSKTSATVQDSLGGTSIRGFSEKVKKLYFKLTFGVRPGMRKFIPAISEKMAKRQLLLPELFDKKPATRLELLAKHVQSLKTKSHYFTALRREHLNLKKLLANQYLTTVSSNNFDLNKLIFFNVLFQNNNKIVEKIEDTELFWGYRQRKYKRFKKYIFQDGHKYDSKTLEPIARIEPKARFLKNNMVETITEFKKTDNAHYFNAIKYNRHRSELVPVNLARRLLRTKRTLVLPAHVNITLITNSYDVVHS